ncbi:uncharacterized protein F54H12.2-like [Pituophis catenifer annectens]|uniref:uncharacterized protein F54H12.2-like n=1 Tax=Pituophis catenifer annectens TaxID=94852 RepID=UPI0039966B7C
MNKVMTEAEDPPEVIVKYDAIGRKIRLKCEGPYSILVTEGLGKILGLQPHGKDNEIITTTYEQPHYVTVNKHYIDTITVEIKTDQNENIAFNHEECVKLELDLFQLAPTQTSIENCTYIEIPPLSALTPNAPLEFFITGHGDHYTDLNNTLLYVSCKVVKADGTDIDDRARVSLVNYPIASLFNQVDVTLGDHVIKQSHHCYAYRALIELILNYSGDALGTQFSAGGFYKDDATLMENTLLTAAGNSGFRARARHTAGSRKWDLLGPLHSDLFFQDKLLINGVDVNIKLSRSKNEFCLMRDGNENYKVQILAASLFVKRVKVSPGVQLGHAEALLNSNAKYPIDRVGMKVYSIPAGSLVCNQENLFLGQLPKQLVIGFVDNAAFSGDYERNPFNFQHYNVNFCALYCDGEQIPAKPLQPDYEHNLFVREYMQFLQTSGKAMKDRSVLINREEFNNGYTLYCFDLSPDQGCSEHYSLIKNGNLRAEIRFAVPLPNTVNMILYAIFENLIEISHTRNVLKYENNAKVFVMNILCKSFLYLFAVTSGCHEIVYNR